MSEDKKQDFLRKVKSISEKIGDTAVNVKDMAMQRIEDANQKQEKRKIASEEKRRELFIKKYSPIFMSDISMETIAHERLIRIINYDSRLENEACNDSIGFYEKTKDRIIPTFYFNRVHQLGITFYPQLSESVYLSDPCVPGKYIEIDEYYNYMKQVRVNELTVIAQSLGAKHVVIALNNSKKASSSLSVDGEGDINAKAKIGTKKSSSFKANKSINIWADTYFKTGLLNSSIDVPKVIYFRNESDISSLIQMVAGNKSKLTKRTYRMQASTSSGLALAEAASISGAMKFIKCGAGANLKSKADIESKSFLEYTIEF